MIDWVSIVRHSRRRFSDYMYSVPIKVRKRRTKRTCQSTENIDRNIVTRGSVRARDICGCCWNHVSSTINVTFIINVWFAESNRRRCIGKRMVFKLTKNVVTMHQKK